MEMPRPSLEHRALDLLVGNQFFPFAQKCSPTEGD